MRFRLSFVAGSIALTCLGTVATASSPYYTVTDLGNLGYSSYASAINSSGQIVGTSYVDSSGTNSRAFLYDDSSTGAKMMVGLFPTGSDSFANGVNNNGQITGSFLNSSYTQGAQTDCYVYNISAQTSTALSFDSSGQPIFPGAYTQSVSVGNAINDSGFVVGQASLYGDTAGTKYGIAYDAVGGQGGLIPDPGVFANSGIVCSTNAVNASGVYVGTLASSDGTTHVAFYSNGSVLTTLHNPADNPPTYYFAEANGINASYQIVGEAIMSSAGTSFHAYRYDVNGTGTMIDLGTLGGASSQAQGINSTAQIVGWSTTTAGESIRHAFIYNGSTMTDLNSLIPGASGWDLIQANAINDSGWIVGYGTNTAGTQDAFLLRPSSPGDANSDGKVDINDLTIVLAHYNQSGLTWLQGDFNGDGKVDINDLTIVLANYNHTFNAPLAAVPEPSAVLMLGLAAVSCATVLGLARRKRN